MHTSCSNILLFATYVPTMMQNSPKEGILFQLGDSWGPCGPLMIKSFTAAAQLALSKMQVCSYGECNKEEVGIQ